MRHNGLHCTRSSLFYAVSMAARVVLRTEHCRDSSVRCRNVDVSNHVYKGNTPTWSTRPTSLCSILHHALRVLSPGPRGQARIWVASTGRAGLVGARAPVTQRRGSGLRRCCRGEPHTLLGRRRARRGFVRRGGIRFKFGDGRRVQLVKLVDAVRRNG